MTHKIFFPIIREFNNISYFNSLVWEMKREGHEITVFCPEKHMMMYPYADHLLVNKNSIYNRHTTEYIEPNKGRFLTEYIGEIDRAKGLNLAEPVDAPKSFDYFGYHIGDDWYRSIFSGTCKMLDVDRETFKWCVPTKERYDFYAQQRPFVVVNGRNLFKKNGTEIYNISFENIIKHFISKGIKVISTTINRPNFSYDPSLYSEPDCIDYNEQLAIFANANMIYSLGDAGAINQHLLAKANFAVCMRDDGPAWVDNVKYGYAGKDLLTVRKEVKSVITTRLSYINESLFINSVDSLANNQPPIQTHFFEFDKVSYL